jgi:hypothetical protein
MMLAPVMPVSEDIVPHACDESVLTRIHEHPVNIAVWQRSLPVPFQDWLISLSSASLPKTRFVARPKECAAIFQDIWKEHGQTDATAMQLSADMARLCCLFSQIMGVPNIHVRLEAVTSNACKKFHIDCVKARLITTYLGPGSEWGYAKEGTIPKRIHQLSTGDVALFKGCLFPGFQMPQVLHRSPPIAGTGMTRLVLCVDSAEGSFSADKTIATQ